MKAIFSNQFVISLIILCSLLCVASFAQAATTIGTDIQTGALTLSGNATTTGNMVFYNTSGVGTTTITGGTVRLNRGVLEIHNRYAQGIDMYSHDDAGFRAPFINFYKSRGSETSPTAATYTGYELDSIGGINFGGYDGSAYEIGAAIYSQTDENWTTAAHGGHLSIYFTRNGAITQNQMVQFGGKDANGAYGPNALFYWPLNYYSNSTTGVNTYGDGQSRLLMYRGDGSVGVTLGVAGKIGAGSTTPVADFQATNVSANATTTMEVGKTGQDKGSCLKLYRTDGSAVYAYIAAGATTFTITTSACANVSNF